MMPSYDEYLQNHLCADFILKELDKKSHDMSLSIAENQAYHTAQIMVERLAQDVYYGWVKHKQEKGEWDAN